MELDRKNWAILEALQQDARLTLTELARRVALSVPAVTERVKRLEEAGVITGYHADVAPQQVGYGLSALIGINCAQPYKNRLLDTLRAAPEVLECCHVTGSDSYIIKVVTRDTRHLEAFIGRINHFGETRTSIVLSVPIPPRAIQPCVPDGT
ncbi:Lrp/AsnC family transcriptional regulator [Pseudogulbenkiania subflava]|uniref:Transcriptional regulator, AsnC family n=1 Tax=Pseudogulbenkiania subflava DSM 22618 TaxID=1123014 RepID=A0A1Y6C4T4_9NEIS|nr:Lrp/AsnC family transcriptional regulator [Pseudogulbenkiania subflava]SMF36987.1 transcriptional regulator, AsnC family [Pseudogulbenkiania subflava DSM 22618]